MPSTHRPTPQHTFAAQYEQGKQAEQLLDRHFARWYKIQTIPLSTERAEGYDRLYIRRHDRQPFKVEYKTDWVAAETGNVFIETISVYEERKPGWMYTSQADVLIYFIPPRGEIHIVKMPLLRMIFPSWKTRYKETFAMNEGYRTYGVLVPLKQFTRFATTHRAAVK
jgi:hypothetical protein